MFRGVLSSATAFVLVTLLSAFPAAADPLSLLDANGKIIGIGDLAVGESVFDVTFSQGGLSYNEALAALATPPGFQFGSVEAATAAAVAIIQFFNTASPRVTGNDVGWDTILDNSHNGDVVIPYSVTSTLVPYVYLSWVGDAPPFEWVLSAPFSFEPDRVFVPAATVAFFTPVPEPPTLVLASVGFALAVFARRSLRLDRFLA